MLRVHPSVREEVAAGLGAVRQAHPAVGVIELVEDVSLDPMSCVVVSEAGEVRAGVAPQIEAIRTALAGVGRSEEHTSELQSLMRISSAVFCLKNKNPHTLTTKFKMYRLRAPQQNEIA